MYWLHELEDTVEAKEDDKKPPLCFCGAVATEKCDKCKVSTCGESWCRSAHNDNYHSQLWSNRA